MNVNKICKKCGGSIFSPQRKCKPCEKARLLKYYKDNREKVIKRSCEWQENNKEKYKERFSTWYKENSESVIAKNRLWAIENKEKAAEYKIKWSFENPEKASEAERRYRRNNPLKVSESRKKWNKKNVCRTRIYAQNRISRKILNGGKISIGLSERLFILQKGRCPCCKEKLGIDYELDHIMPLALGGSNTDDNIQLLRKTCNRQKSAKHPFDFMQSRGFLF